MQVGSGPRRAAASPLQRRHCSLRVGKGKHVKLYTVAYQPGAVSCRSNFRHGEAFVTPVSLVLIMRVRG